MYLIPGAPSAFKRGASRLTALLSPPKCLCLAPTYELALQIGRVIETIGRFCADIKVTYAVRGNRGESGPAEQSYRRRNGSVEYRDPLLEP